MLLELLRHFIFSHAEPRSIYGLRRLTTERCLSQRGRTTRVKSCRRSRVTSVTMQVKEYLEEKYPHLDMSIVVESFDIKLVRDISRPESKSRR